MKTKILSTILATAFLLGAPALSHAAATACHDAKGKFVKCPTVAAAMATPAATTAKTQCKDAKGKFTKCPTAPAATSKPKQCRDTKSGKFIKCPA